MHQIVPLAPALEPCDWHKVMELPKPPGNKGNAPATAPNLMQPFHLKVNPTVSYHRKTPKARISQRKISRLNKLLGNEDRPD